VVSGTASAKVNSEPNETPANKSAGTEKASDGESHIQESSAAEGTSEIGNNAKTGTIESEFMQALNRRDMEKIDRATAERAEAEQNHHEEVSEAAEGRGAENKRKKASTTPKVQYRMRTNLRQKTPSQRWRKMARQQQNHRCGDEPIHPMKWQLVLRGPLKRKRSTDFRNSEGLVRRRRHKKRTTPTTR
jgi:hypothetical protein